MNKMTYEQELERTGRLVYTTVGRSMRPFLRSQEDLVIIQRKTEARYSKYDAVLYRRASGKYVLHRIVKVCPDSYTMCGDNCADLEPGITHEQVLGVLTGVIRNGKHTDVNTDDYRRKVRLWVALYPLRAVFIKAKGLLYRIWKRLKRTPKLF